MALSFSQCAALASVATQTVAAIMRKRTSVERREAFLQAYDAANADRKRALFGAVAILFARLDAIPEAKATEAQS